MVVVNDIMVFLVSKTRIIEHFNVIFACEIVNKSWLHWPMN